VRRVQKTDDVVAVVERIIGKVQSKSEGKDFTFPYDLRAILHTEDRRTKRDTLLRENTHYSSLFLSSSVFRDV